MKKQLEIRHFPGLEFRAADSERKLAGYAAVFNSDSVDFGLFREQIAPGAFTRTLRENPDVRALVDHDTGKVIARTKAGTLSLREDEKGLFAEMSVAETSHGNDIMSLVRRGDVDGMSFGFFIDGEKWEKRGGKDYRIITEVSLFEVSVVAFPAYPASSVDVRSVEQVYASRPKDEEEVTYSRTSHVRRMIALSEKLL